MQTVSREQTVSHRSRERTYGGTLRHVAAMGTLPAWEAYSNLEANTRAFKTQFFCIPVFDGRFGSSVKFAVH